MKKEYIIPIFVPHLGCKKCCTFCNQRTISGEKKQVTAKDVTNTIEYYLKNFKNENNYVEVAFFGGSFTAIEREKQEELLSAVQPYIEEKKVDSIRLSTRPDAVDKDILRMLKKYNVKTIELGVQSTNNYILARCKRGHSFEDVKKAFYTGADRVVVKYEICPDEGVIKEPAARFGQDKILVQVDEGLPFEKNYIPL